MVLNSSLLSHYIDESYEISTIDVRYVEIMLFGGLFRI